MEILRTPDDRFRDLPDFPYEPRYVTVGEVRIHYVDAGPTDAAPVLLPSLVPTSRRDPAAPANRQAWQALERFDKPFLTTFADRDPITRGGERVLQRRIPGAQGQPHQAIRGAGHFLQEDRGPELGQIMARFIADTSE